MKTYVMYIFSVIYTISWSDVIITSVHVATMLYCKRRKINSNSTALVSLYKMYLKQCFCSAFFCLSFSVAYLETYSYSRGQRCCPHALPEVFHLKPSFLMLLRQVVLRNYIFFKIKRQYYTIIDHVWTYLIYFGVPRGKNINQRRNCTVKKLRKKSIKARQCSTTDSETLKDEDSKTCKTTGDNVW